MNILEIKDLAINYDKKQILHDITFDIPQGSYLSIIGENGAGKSSLIKAILGLIKYNGDIKYNIPKNSIGYIPQQTELQKDFPATVFEIVMSGFVSKLRFRPFFNAKEKARAKEIMTKLNIIQFENRGYRELSGGQQQKVLLARALCACEGVLVLDEPTAGLDRKSTEEFYRTLDKLNKEDGITIIMVIHDIPMAVKKSSHILYLKETVAFYGTATDFAKTTHYNLICDTKEK